MRAHRLGRGLPRGSTPRPARSYAEAPHFAGLHADEAMARTIWNAHPAALCCDNPAVEVVPGDPAVGSLHRRLLPTLGTALGEMFDLDELAAACRADGRCTFFFVAAPLNLPGGHRLARQRRRHPMTPAERSSLRASVDTVAR